MSRGLCIVSCGFLNEAYIHIGLIRRVVSCDLGAVRCEAVGCELWVECCELGAGGSELWAVESCELGAVSWDLGR